MGIYNELSLGDTLIKLQKKINKNAYMTSGGSVSSMGDLSTNTANAGVVGTGDTAVKRFNSLISEAEVNKVTDGNVLGDYMSGTSDINKTKVIDTKTKTDTSDLTDPVVDEKWYDAFKPTDDSKALAKGTAIAAATTTALNSINSKPDEFTAGDRALNTLTGAFSGAASGASVGGVPGAIVGAVVGLGKGVVGNKKKQRGINKELDIIARQEATAQNFQAQDESVKRIQSISESATSMYSDVLGNQSYGYAREGAIFKVPKHDNINFFSGDFEGKLTLDKVVEKKPFRMFRKGGTIKHTENIIPNGVMHEEDNQIGSKGMPVVYCTNGTCDKKYEIEKNELILTQEATLKINELAATGEMEELGDFLATQLIDNTYSFTDKYKHLNN